MNSTARACLGLAALLTRSDRAEPIEVGTVVPHRSTPSIAGVDAEFAAWAGEQGEGEQGEAARSGAREAAEAIVAGSS